MARIHVDIDDTIADTTSTFIDFMIHKYKFKINKEELNDHAYNKIINAQTQLDNVRLEAQSLFNKAYKYGSDENKKVFQNLEKMIAHKNSVSYSGEVYEAKDIDLLWKHLDRFKTWAEDLLRR